MFLSKHTEKETNQNGLRQNNLSKQQSLKHTQSAELGLEGADGTGSRARTHFI